MDNTSSGTGITMDSSLSILEEKRLRRREKNKVKKEESKRVREEEIRRKLYEPKNQRVRLVNHKEVEMLQGFSTSTNYSKSTLPIPVTSENFPNLGSGKHKTKPTKRFTGLLTETENRCRTKDQLQTQAPPEASLQEGDNCSQPLKTDGRDATVNKNLVTSQELEMEQLVCQSAATSQSAKPKRADPIKIDLLSVLKKSPNMIEKKVPSVAVKKKVLSNLHGNQLDASNPERKKGKTRENPKPQKPTHLKSVILQDRQADKEKLEMPDAVHKLKGSSVANDQILAQRMEHPEEPSRVRTNDNQTSEITNLCSTTTETITAEGLEQCPLDSGLLILCNQIGMACRDNVVEYKQILLENQGVSPSSPEEIVQNMSALKVDRDKTSSSIHNKKFRDYCDHMPSPELDNSVTALVTDIVKFQDRLYFSDPVKAHAKRRFVLGFRETKKYLGLRKLKLIIIAPDLETARSKGGIDDTVAELKEVSQSQGVLCVFSVGRSVLRKLTNKSCAVKGISCIGVINYEGSQDNYHTIQNILPALRCQYQHLVEPREESRASTSPSPINNTITETEDEPVDVNKQVVTTFLVKLAKELEKK